MQPFIWVFTICKKNPRLMGYLVYLGLKLCYMTSSTTPNEHHDKDFSRDMRFPKMWYVRPAMAQTSLLICAVCSEPLLVARIFYEY